jgi:putative transposase
MQYVAVEGNVRRRWSLVKDFERILNQDDFWSHMSLHLRQLTKNLIELSLEEDMTTFLQRRPYQRSEATPDYRNGSYCRDLDTTLGPLENIVVPRSRSGLFRPKIFARYARRQELVNTLVCNVFLRGVSTRDVAATLKPLLGVDVSASCVSRIAKRLDHDVNLYHQRPLLDEYQFLFLDGIALSVKGARQAKKILVLVAYGISLFGTKELISFRLARAESTTACEGFLNDLYHRGLHGKNLKLIVTDGSQGFINAIDLVYPHPKHQRCWVHKLRNATKTVKKVDLKSFKRDIQSIYNADSYRQALKRFSRFKNTWQHSYPKAVACIEQDLDSLLAFFSIQIKEPFRAFIRRQIRTTNIIERSFREVRRRTRPMSCFQNTDSVQRIIYAIFCRLNTKWKAKPLAQFTQFI